MNERELKRLLGKDDYRILNEVFEGKLLQELTMNRILDLYRKLIVVGLLKDTSSIEAVRGRPIEVILRRDSYDDRRGIFYNDEPEKPAKPVHITRAAALLEEVGITPTGA